MINTRRALEASRPSEEGSVAPFPLNNLTAALVRTFFVHADNILTPLHGDHPFPLGDLPCTLAESDDEVAVVIVGFH